MAEPRASWSSSFAARAAVAAAALSAFGICLFSRAWPRDDRALLLENPLLRAGWPGARRLLLSSYVSPFLGRGTPIHEWRPVLSLSFLLQRAATGFSPWPLHAVNLALHAAVGLLVLEVLRRRLPAAAALAGALVFAVLPVHAEVVAYLTSRSELLAALAVLGAGLALDAPREPGARRLAAGAGLYLLGALSKEHALLFPGLLALSDWTFRGLTPWEPRRRRTYLALGLCAALVLAGRAVVLPRVIAGGVPYFGGGTPLLTRLLTLSKFWVWHYARPAALGVGLCSDFARPLIPDSGPGDVAAWAALVSLLLLLGMALRAVLRREAWGFWVLGPGLFLLPTSHLLFDLDTLGAQRFLYLPCLGLAAGAGALYAAAARRKPAAAKAALALALAWLAGRSALRAADWLDDEAYYRAAIACNPVSARARMGLGLALLREGRPEGEAKLDEALALDPGLYDAAFNLARLAYGRGQFSKAALLLSRARALRPGSADGLELQALLEERAGRLDDARRDLEAAANANPDDPVAPYDLARILARQGRRAEAAARLQEFLRLAPDDPDAPAARRWRAELLAGAGR